MFFLEECFCMYVRTSVSVQVRVFIHSMDCYLRKRMYTSVKAEEGRQTVRQNQFVFMLR